MNMTKNDFKAWLGGNSKWMLTRVDKSYFVADDITSKRADGAYMYSIIAFNDQDLLVLIDELFLEFAKAHGAEYSTKDEVVKAFNAADIFTTYNLEKGDFVNFEYKAPSVIVAVV